MAKTIAALSGLCTTLADRIEAAQKSITDLKVLDETVSDAEQASALELVRQKVQLAHTEKQLGEEREVVKAQTKENADLRTEIALLRQQLDDFRKRIDK